MVRSILGVVVGALAWMAVFYVLAIGLSLLWPDYPRRRGWSARVDGGVLTQSTHASG